MAYLSLLFFGFYEKKNGRKGILRRERVFFEERFAPKRRVAKFFLRSSHGDTEPQSFY